MNKKYLLLILLLVLVVGFWSFVFHLVSSNFGKGKNDMDYAFRVEKLLVDQALVGGTGLEFGHAGRVWLNTLDGHSIVYNGSGDIIQTKTEDGSLVPLAVKVEGSPMGQVFSGDHAFSKDAFVFNTLEGKILGWHKSEDTGLEPLSATVKIDNSSNGVVYTGLTSAKVDGEWRLYSADNANNKVEMYDSEYKPIVIENAFIDSTLPEGYSVYNLKEINGSIYATYNNNDTGRGGAINIFDLNGRFIKRLVTDGELNSPWGLASTKNGFGNFTGKLIVGNSTNGEINVYGLTDGTYYGKVKDENGDVLSIPGLMALTFGTNNGAGKVNELFFSSGSDEEIGIFGKLQLVIEPTRMSQPLIKKGRIEAMSREDNNIDEKFLTEKDIRMELSEFNKFLETDCLENCVSEKLSKKSEELKIIYNKIFSDAKVIKDEFSAQGFGEEKIAKIDALLGQLEALPVEDFLKNADTECQIMANSYYAGESLASMKDTCVLYKTTTWVNQMYILRSIYIRVELGPLGMVKDIKTDAFKNLIDEEENRINKSY